MLLGDGVFPHSPPPVVTQQSDGAFTEYRIMANQTILASLLEVIKYSWCLETKPLKMKLQDYRIPGKIV